VSDIGPIIAALATGIFLGALFFGGLWWTVRRGLTVANPALWFGVSAVGPNGNDIVGPLLRGACGMA
jgi:uncharacterized membrane protein YfbV (UPF0208 family)